MSLDMNSTQINEDSVEICMKTLESYIKNICEGVLKTPFSFSSENRRDRSTVISFTNTFGIDETCNIHLVANLEDCLLDHIDINVSTFYRLVNKGHIHSPLNSIMQNLIDNISEGISNNLKDEIRSIMLNKEKYLSDGLLADFLLRSKEGFLHIYLMRFIPA